MIYDDCQIINIYRTKSGSAKGRERIYLLMPDGTRKMMNYSRYLMERELNQQLPRTTFCRYKDGNISNNKISNLHLEENPRIEFICPICKKKFLKKAKKLKTNYDKSIGRFKGPFCSIECKRKARELEIVKFKCPQCNKEFEMSGSQLKFCRRNHKQKDRYGPFCSNICAGKYIAARNPHIQSKKHKGT